MEEIRIAVLVTTHKNVAQLNQICGLLAKDFDVYAHYD